MFLEIGKINKPHGLSGELKATIDQRYLADVAQNEAFFVNIRGAHTPYFIEYTRGKGKIILKLEDIDNKEDASLLTNKPLYLRREDVQLSDAEIQDNGLEYQFLEGFEMSDQELGLLGIIETIESYPQQEMATLKFKKGHCLIPIHENWIVSIDLDKYTILMNLPEGLIEL